MDSKSYQSYESVHFKKWPISAILDSGETYHLSDVYLVSNWSLGTNKLISSVKLPSFKNGYGVQG